MVVGSLLQVDKATSEFDKRAPPLAKQAVQMTLHFVQKAAQTGQELVNEFRSGGPRAAFHYAAKEYKQLVVNQGGKIWARLDQFPSVHKFSEMAGPSAARWLERYNSKVKELRQKGYYVFAYFPEVPVSEIGKAFKQCEAKNKEEASLSPSTPEPAPTENKPDSDSESESESESVSVSK